MLYWSLDSIKSISHLKYLFAKDNQGLIFKFKLSGAISGKLNLKEAVVEPIDSVLSLTYISSNITDVLKSYNFVDEHNVRYILMIKEFAKYPDLFVCNLRKKNELLVKCADTVGNPKKFGYPLLNSYDIYKVDNIQWDPSIKDAPKDITEISRNDAIILRFICKDCGKNTISSSDYYMVNNNIWKKYGVDGMLCLKCLERRIGRKLVFEDFTDCLLNRNNEFVKGLAKQ